MNGGWGWWGRERFIQTQQALPPFYTLQNSLVNETYSGESISAPLPPNLCMDGGGVGGKDSFKPNKLYPFFTLQNSLVNETCSGESISTPRRRPQLKAASTMFQHSQGMQAGPKSLNTGQLRQLLRLLKAAHLLPCTICRQIARSRGGIKDCHHRQCWSHPGTRYRQPSINPQDPGNPHRHLEPPGNMVVVMVSVTRWSHLGTQHRHLKPPGNTGVVMVPVTRWSHPGNPHRHLKPPGKTVVVMVPVTRWSHPGTRYRQALINPQDHGDPHRHLKPLGNSGSYGSCH